MTCVRLAPHTGSRRAADCRSAGLWFKNRAGQELWALEWPERPANLGHEASRATLKQQLPHRGFVLNKFAANTAAEVLAGVQGALDFIRLFVKKLTLGLFLLGQA